MSYFAFDSRGPGHRHRFEVLSSLCGHTYNAHNPPITTATASYSPLASERHSDLRPCTYVEAADPPVSVSEAHTNLHTNSHYFGL